MLLLLGGVRSGKSTLAVQLAAHHQHVTFLATAEPGDEEMRDRIAAHQTERPRTWVTVEEPIALGRAIEAVDPACCLVIDCLTLWAANRLPAGAAVVEAEARDAASAAARRFATTIVVSNEVGMGVVPASEIGRAFRDTLGRVNAIWAGAATECFLVVAGRRLELRA